MEKQNCRTLHSVLDSEELIELDSTISGGERLFGPFNYSKKTLDEIVDMTTVVPLFNSFDPSQLRVIVPHMQIVHMAKGQCLFFEGEAGDYMCFIISGRMEVFKDSVGGKLVSVSTISRGSSIGEMAMIDTYSRSATVIAKEATTTLVLKREHFDQILEADPQTGIVFLKALSRIVCLHLRRTSNQYADICETAGEDAKPSGLQEQFLVGAIH
ncbi:cyclic nucleotide-binding domain-containing protein [Mariprofundus ferrooxydans]|uniref:cyclic nucleotide-binding domain-containing protein n=1 Tax=Mariprofundus ferrooxydans TaxID=314344 RepID=UPI001F0FD0FD|nr:cyclic nucleotide-binding domain-containing protein [Mariprofundus ferrooxydans]